MMMDASSGSSLRSTFRANIPPQATIRAVTPELGDPAHTHTHPPSFSATNPTATAHGAASSAGISTSTRTTITANATTTTTTTKHPDADTVARPSPIATSNLGFTSANIGAAPQHKPRPGLSPISPQASSPRTLPGGPIRRQGIIFNDMFDGPSDDSAVRSSTPPPPRLPTRQRTYTMETPGIRPPAVASLAANESRRRIGSFSSASSQQINDDARPAGQPLESLGFPSIVPSRQPEPSQEQSAKPQAKDKKMSARRLIKRQSSRPTSPLISPPPSVDSLPSPIPTEDANKILLLMRNLCGRMRGDIEYQLGPAGPWIAGMAYIEEEKGSLMFDSGHDGPFHSSLIPDLRGCRVIPINHPEEARCNCLQIITSCPSADLVLRPLVAEEIDLWLAALLCWQQCPPSTGKPASPAAPNRPELRRQSSNGPGVKTASIIKVGKVMLWDKGLATSPRAIVKRPSTRDLRSPSTSWRRVSCILQDNGELKLLTETDSSILSVIELSQLSRCAIQQLDRTVLDEEFCIAIFPIYSSLSTQLSIFRPVYIALETRVHFEVWFVLLRAYTVPDLYRSDPENLDCVAEISHENSDVVDGMFRVEKSLTLRITEAKIRSKGGSALELGNAKELQDNLVGNYLAEVILDGEVRAKTTTKPQTKNPFWREDCAFHDLPPSLPYLSIVLKKVEGNLEGSSHPHHSSLPLPGKMGNPTEVLCGSVDIALQELERGKDHEQWLQILDAKQQCIGTMFVKLHHEELVVLLAKEYQPLSELLHRFPSGLTPQIAEAMPTRLRRLSEMFLNIFQGSSTAAEWLMVLVEDEIDGIGNQASIRKYRFSKRLRSSESMESVSDREQIVRDMSRSLTGEANLLFRGNSLLTHALEFHMRRLGKEYLEDVLQDKIFEINEANPNCEVDPTRVQQGDDLHEHWERLMQLTTDVWGCIAGSANRLPPELRHILKYIRAVAEDRYGDFLRTVSYTSVSGFLFLRFLCPAILSPKMFGLLRDLPLPRAQRTFTLIAKALQALANLSTFGQKEAYMEPMNKFLNAHRQSVKDFIDQVCAIPAERSANPVPASYSTPVTISGRLSPAAREGFPCLPYLVDQARNFAALVRLWVDANPLSGGVRVNSSATSPPSDTSPPSLSPASGSGSGSASGRGSGSGSGSASGSGSRSGSGDPSSAAAAASLGLHLTGTTADRHSQHAIAAHGIDAQSVPEGDLVLFNDMCTALQRRADSYLARVEALRSKEAATTPSLHQRTPDEFLADMLENTSLADPSGAGVSVGAMTTSPATVGGFPALSSAQRDAEHVFFGPSLPGSGSGSTYAHARPPGSSGSDVVDTRNNSASTNNTAGSSSRDERRGRSARQASSSENGSAASGSGSGGTLRSSRNGRVTRGILSGIMRMGRSDSPDSGPRNAAHGQHHAHDNAHHGSISSAGSVGHGGAPVGGGGGKLTKGER